MVSNGGSNVNNFCIRVADFSRNDSCVKPSALSGNVTVFNFNEMLYCF
jgi:hypothetical protein